MISEMLRWLNDVFAVGAYDATNANYFVPITDPTPVDPQPEKKPFKPQQPKKVKSLPPVKCKKTCIICGDCNLSLDNNRCISCRINLRYPA